MSNSPALKIKEDAITLFYQTLMLNNVSFCLFNIKFLYIKRYTN